MDELTKVAPVFVEMAHQIVWCSAATVDPKGRPRSRVFHPIWQWDWQQLIGWIATTPNRIKRAHLKASPYISLNYWSPSQDTCVAECQVSWALDDQTRTRVWNLFLEGPSPVGYDPANVTGWENPTSEAFGVLKVDPWRLRVFPGSMFRGQGGEVLNWRKDIT